MPKEKFHIEFVMGSATQASLWRMISKPEGLSEWFSDEVDVIEENTIFRFHWGKSYDDARIIALRPMSSIRYVWEEDEEKSQDEAGSYAIYFEFQLHKLELSNEIALQITDFAEPEDKSDAIALWESQIEEMKRRLGV